MQSGEEDKQGELQDDSRDLQAESRFQPRARARSTSGGFGLGADEDGYVTNGASTTANGKRKSSQSPRGQRGKKHRRRPSSPKSFWATVLGWSPQLLRQRSRQALELPSLSPTPHRFTGTRFYLSPATLTCVRTAGTRLGRVRKAQRGKPWSRRRGRVFRRHRGGGGGGGAGGAHGGAVGKRLERTRSRHDAHPHVRGLRRFSYIHCL